jgi:superfamily II DNA or RNA helicase
VHNQQTITSHELVFAITSHPVLGYLIEAFAVARTSKNLFEYGFKKVTRHTWQDYFEKLPDAYMSMIEILHKIADENLHKRFNPSSVKINRFFETLEPEYITKHVRPFVEKILYMAVECMVENSLPLYLKGEAGERIQETPLVLHRELADTCFHFEKLPQETHYRLEVRQQGHDLNLFKRNAILLTQLPCLLLLDGNLLRFEPQWDGKKLSPFFEKEFLVVPKSSEKQFFQKFVQKSILYHPFKAYGFEVKLIDQVPVTILRMEEHWQGGVVLGLYFKYSDGSIVRMDDPVKKKIKFIENENDFRFEKVIRNCDYEEQIIAFLRSLELIKIDGPFFSLLPPSSNALNSVAYNVERQVMLTVDWFNDNFEKIRSKGIVCEKSIFNKTYHSGTYSINLRTEEKHDWFDLHGIIRFGEFEVPFAYLTENILSGNREYTLPNGNIAIIPEEWMSKYQDIMKFGIRRGRSMQLKKHHFSLLARVQESGVHLPGYNQKSLLDKYDIPPMINAQLRNYQQEGFNWMMFLKNNRMGGCLADDMGLGKTLQALSILVQAHRVDIVQPSPEPTPQLVESLPLVPSHGQLILFPEGGKNQGEDTAAKANCSLIIMPLSLIHNWLQEITRFAPTLKVLQHTGSSRTQDLEVFSHYDLVLTTYGTVRNDVDLLEKFLFRYIILDESQIIKNASSRIFSAIRKLHAQYRLTLTGTPIENSLTDLWSQFSFINPGMLGSLTFFKNEFVNPIEKRNDEAVGEKLHKLIEPFILRRTKNQVAKELPPLTEKIHYCEMTPEQASYYETKKSEIRNAIIQSLHENGPDKARFFLLSGLTKLRLIANHPAIIDRQYQHESGKYIEIQRSIGNLMSENHKVLIFSQFVKYLNLLVNDFEKQKLTYSLLTGKVIEKDRQQVVNNFQKDDLNRLFLISLKAGGLGLNLTQADYVFMLDPWWNPAVERQAINRAHRIGQHKNVFVYKFITRNTVEEKILKLQQKKSDLAGLFINENNPAKSLSFDELNELI